MPKRSENKAEFTTENTLMENSITHNNSVLDSPATHSDNVLFDTNICLYNKGVSSEFARSPIKLSEQGAQSD